MRDGGRAPAISLNGVTRTFGTRPAIVGVRLVVERGEVVLLRGANGAGKSTLLRVVATALSPTYGGGAVLGVARDGRDLGRMTPSLNLYPSASEPIGTPSIRSGPLRDLYASVVGVEQDGEQATFRLFLNPGVAWLWVGGGVMVLGGLLAVWPTRRRPALPGPAVGPARQREPAAVGRG